MGVFRLIQHGFLLRIFEYKGVGLPVILHYIFKEDWKSQVLYLDRILRHRKTFKWKIGSYFTFYIP